MAKITRAKQHIQDFQLAASAFNNTGPYAVSVKEDLKSGKRIFYLSKVYAIPDSLTAIAADIIQNLRSPLDQIAYQLVFDSRGSTAPDWKVYFPICGSAAQYPSMRRGYIKGVRQEVIDAIDATEPYKGGKGHALWQLNELNKPDKHILLLSAGAISTGIDFSVRWREETRQLYATNPIFMGREMPEIPQVFLVPAEQFAPMKVGDELWIEPINPKVDNNRPFTFDISFDAPGIVKFEPAIKTLQDMTNLVSNVVTELGRLLP